MVWVINYDKYVTPLMNNHDSDWSGCNCMLADVDSVVCLRKGMRR